LRPDILSGDTPYALVALGGCIALVVWFLHAGGWRRSTTLGWFERRFPRTAEFFQLASPEAIRRLHPGKPPAVHRRFEVARKVTTLPGAVVFAVAACAIVVVLIRDFL
jgi:hypothetical protein